MRKRVKKMLAILLSIMMVFTLTPIQFLALESGELKTAELNSNNVENGVWFENDLWKQEIVTVKGMEIFEVKDDMLHIKSEPDNGNNWQVEPYPAIFALENYVMPKSGVFDITFTMPKSPDPSWNNRIGVYMNYTDPANTFFVGYDGNGWFWEKYEGSKSDWYQGDRVAGPAAGESVKLHLEWSDNTLKEATINGGRMFAVMPQDFSNTGSGGGIALKAGSYGQNFSEYYVSGVDYTGKSDSMHRLNGKVTTEDGTAIPGVIVSAQSAVVKTADDGTYYLMLREGDAVLKFEKDRFVTTQKDITVSGDATLENEIMDYEDWAFAPNVTWVIDPATEKGGEICELEDGKWHFASAGLNSNNPTTMNCAAYFILQDYVLPDEGYFEATFISEIPTSQNRIGVHLYYDNPGNGLLVGADNGGWFWQNYNGNSGDYYRGSRQPSLQTGQPSKIRLEWSGKFLTKATVNGTDMFSTMPHDFSSIGGNGLNLAIKCGTYSKDYSNIYLYDVSYTGQQLAEAYQVTGSVVNENGTPIDRASVSIGNLMVTTDDEGRFAVKGLVDGTYDVTVSVDHYNSYTGSVTIDKSSIELPAIMLNQIASNTTVISSSKMDVEVDFDFPRVVQYTMKDSDKVFYGQTSALDTIVINGIDIKPIVTSSKKGDKDKVVYEIAVQNAENHIDAVLTAEIFTKDNNLTFEITEVENKLNNDEYPIESIYIPNHSLISVRSTQSNPQFAGAVMSVNTQVSGDRFYNLEEMSVGTAKYIYAFISNDELAAGIWSNSEEGTSTSNTGITSTVQERSGYKTLGLGSSFWYYNRKIDATGSNASKKGGPWVMNPTDTPQVKIVITDDENESRTVDWQDAAIAYRTIMHSPQGSEETPELVAWRIAMNFGSHAQNPFLMTLDNAKRVAMNTDGLGQSVLLKGYGNEGHDSAHPDYSDIGTRMGGAVEFNKLLEEGSNIGARFGIHINAGEMYPEAKAFDDLMVRRNNEGTLRYGWNWIDQGIGIDGLYDLGSGNRQNRLQELKDVVGDNLDFIYLDIWGNNTSNENEDAWQTRNVMKQINDLGWKFGTEFGAVGEYGSTFQHWAMDLEYGGYSNKGHNSIIMRFIRNHERDTWVAERSSFKGAAVAPLLGGEYMTDFEGWQGRNNYKYYIESLFSFNLVTKYLQHFTVVEWITETTPVNIGGVNWYPEKKITLKDNEGNVVVVERKSTNYKDPSAYRSRTITLNGNVILKGEMAEMIQLYKISQKKETYLIPWQWDTDGNKLDYSEEKLYHWNADGGTTEWTLPTGWKDLSTVMLYELTDLGRVNEQEIQVKDGKIQLNAVKTTPYVLYRGKAATMDNVKWSAGMHVWDAGFNSGKLDHWSKDGSGTAEIRRSELTNPMLALEGEIAMTQQVTDLKPGQRYVAYVGIDNRSTGKASITIRDGNEILDTNYTITSIAKNYVKAYEHNTNKATVIGSSGSYFQNMFVYFNAPEDVSDVTITLSLSGGIGIAYFDSIRITENEAENIVATDEDTGSVTHFKQDFENNAQGIYPFVVSGSEGVEDNRIHLSELHAPYTQAGWDVKKGDDVLDGTWSLKVNGLVMKDNLLYQTIPQNFRFEPGESYTIRFDYQMGSPGIYQFVVGDGEFKGVDSLTKRMELESEIGSDDHIKTKTFETMITGSESGQTWIGIYSTSTAPDLKGTTSNAANFSGYKEIVLDNLEIVANNLHLKDDLKTLADKAVALNQDEYTEETWKTLTDALNQAKSVLPNEDATMDEIKDTYHALKDAIAKLEKKKVEEKLSQNAPKGLIANAPTEKGAANGTITGVTTAMEFRPASDTNYTACTGTKIIGLTAGKYYVRYTETATHKSSPDTEIIVPEGATLIPHTPGPETEITVPASKANLDIKNRKSYIAGYSDNTVRPGSDITRAEAAQILYNLLTKESLKDLETSKNKFSDVNSENWANTAISTLSNAGVISGYPDGSFKPNASLTRAELVSMICKFFDVAKEKLPQTSFTDIGGHWATNNIAFASYKGWINGYPDGTFKPNQSITRAETVSIVNSVMGRVPDEMKNIQNMKTFKDNMNTNAWYYVCIQLAANTYEI